MLKFVQKVIELNKIVIGANVRLQKNYNAGPLMDSILGQGLQTRLWVRDNAGTFELLRGHRRMDAIQSIAIHFPEKYQEMFGKGIPCEVVQCTNAEALELKVDHGNVQGLVDPFEIQLAANMLFAAGCTEEAVANILSGIMNVLIPPTGEHKKKLAEVDEKINNANDDCAKVNLQRERREMVLAYRRGLVQTLRATYRCPDTVMIALKEKAEGNGWGPTQAQTKKLLKAFQEDLSVCGPNGLPKYSKSIPGPSFETEWQAMKDESKKGAGPKEKRAKSRSAIELGEAIKEGRFRSITVQRTIQWASGLECPDLNMLDETAMLAEQAKTLFVDEWKLLEAKVLKALSKS